MRAVGLSGALALAFALFGTRLAIGWFTKHGFGQPIRVDGPTTHHVKRGTPTMGGVVIVVGATAAYLIATFLTGSRPSASAWLLLLLFAGCAAVGFLDDFIKVYRQHNQGLRSGAKMAGQTFVALAFGILATQFFAERQGSDPGVAVHLHDARLGDQAALGRGPARDLVRRHRDLQRGQPHGRR